MKKFVLRNGLTVIIKKRQTESVAIEATIKCGSNNESKRIGGISHFIEHMLFEGTRNRTTMQIANEIESIGGEINAATSHEKTIYYIVVLKKYFDRALSVLSDILQNPLFDEKAVEKERKIILDEVNLTIDDPKIHQWILFQKNLFKKHPCRYPIYGTRESIRTMGRKDLLDYYSKYYMPNNMILTIVGNVNNVLLKIEKAFSFSQKSVIKQRSIIEPKQIKPKKFIEKRKILQSCMVFGYKAVPRSHKDSYVFDVIRAILGRGQSSKLFDEIRTKRGLAYNVGVHYEAGVDYGWIAVYVGTDKKNIEKIKQIILQEIRKLRNISKEDVDDAKNFIEGDYLLSNEDNKTMADTLGFWELNGNVQLVKDYVKKIKKITEKDVAKIAKKYFGRNFTYIVIKQL